MDKFLDYRSHQDFNVEIIISGSKSESNRLLILQELYPEITIKNLSNSNDSKVLVKALDSDAATIDIGHAGTAMRFLTAYYASKEGADVMLSGSKRMHERPIQILVDALVSLGADISYVKNEGYPPLHIKGKKLNKEQITISGSVSSQYISALLLIAPKLPNGLTIKIAKGITSLPYVRMTIALLHSIGAKTNWNDNEIRVHKLEHAVPKTLVVESDWSSASYYYSLVALSNNGKVKLAYFKEESLQGDSALVDIYKKLGVETVHKNQQLTLIKNSAYTVEEHITLDLVDTPDIAQTIAVTCFGLGIACKLTGLHTLRIKETDRLQALKTELEKLGGKVTITEDTLHLHKDKGELPQQPVKISTYDDHRMAMAFAPLSLKTPLVIEDPDVVKKSYTDFWQDMEKIKN